MHKFGIRIEGHETGKYNIIMLPSGFEQGEASVYCSREELIKLRDLLNDIIINDFKWEVEFE